MSIALRSIQIPDFGLPLELPAIPAVIYEKRVQTLYERAKANWVVVYADREHHANIAFLTGFEPRFEEALLLLGPEGRRVLIVGNESISYAPLAGLPKLELVLSQSMSLMGQARSERPNLEAILREIGLLKSDTVGLAGWKYLGAEEWSGELPTFQVPAFIVDTLKRIVADPAAITDSTSVLMHPETGLRSVVDVHQIAAGEWGASRASAAAWRILSGVRVGDSEYLAASRMGYAGEVLNAHLMLASSSKGHPVVGLRSPTARVLKRGDGVTTAISYWGGLSSRAGLISDGDDAFLTIAKSYFKGLVAWYDVADIGVEGGTIFEVVTEALKQGGLNSALNPGHLVGHDEWMHTPIRPQSVEKIASGMPFQIDVIPTPVPAGWALNCEDAVTFADASLRQELKTLYPDVHARIEARRAFMRAELGVDVKPNILPLSSTPLCLAPFWLAPDKLLVQG